MPTSIAALQEQIAQQATTIAQFQPVLQASLDLTGVAVAKLEELFQLVESMKGATPTQEQIDQLSAAVGTARDTIAGDIESVNVRNAALAAELEKIKPPTGG